MTFVDGEGRSRDGKIRGSGKTSETLDRSVEEKEESSVKVTSAETKY